MKRLAYLPAICFFALAAAGPAAEAPNQTSQVLALVKEVQAQQITIAENQARIEAKLATIAEAVRVAKIYASRGGK